MEWSCLQPQIAKMEPEEIWVYSSNPTLETFRLADKEVTG